MSRIAFLTTVDCAWGGSEVLWSETALRMAKEFPNIEVHAIASLRVSNEKLVPLQQAGCVTHYLPKFRRPQRIFDRQKFKWFDQVKPDLVVLSLAAHNDGLEWMTECQRRQIPYVLIIQSVVETVFHRDDFVNSMRPAYEAAQALYFVSRGNIEFVRTHFATQLPKAEVVHNPFNVSYDAAPPWPDTHGNTAFRLACVARLEPVAKGQDILFDVLKAEKWKSRDLKVTLFGEGLTSETLKKLKEMYDLKNVTFGGFVSNIEEVWSQYHALVLPSRFEGLPLSLVEAMLCGRTAIVTDVAGNAEMIEDGVNGFVARAPKASLLDEALESAWLRRSEWRQMGQEAARKVRESVPREPALNMARKLESLLAKESK